MLLKSLLRACASVLPIISTVSYAQPDQIDQDALAFSARESVSNMDISPDGTKAVITGAGPGRTTIVYFADLVAGSTKPILSSKGDPEALEWCAFATAERLICKFSGIYNDSGTLLPASRLISIATDGSGIKEMGQRASRDDIGPRQFDGSVIDWMPGDGKHVLMTRVYLPEGGKTTSTNINRTKQGLGVVRIDPATAKIDEVEPPRNNIDRYMSDGQGRVRLMGIVERSGEVMLTGRVKYQYRRANSREWETLSEYQDERAFIPLAIDASVDSLYALKKLEGRYALYAVKLDGSMETTLVAKDANVDIDDVVRSGDGQRVIGYSFSKDYREVVYFDPQYKGLRGSLTKAVPGQPEITFAGTSGTGGKTLLFAGRDDNPGSYYLFDQSKKSLSEILPVRPNLAGRTLAAVKPIQYTASDGTIVPAYLTLPVGKEAKQLPAIVLPHGGPSARDTWGFDWLPQFFAARGYAVIQPNYRGSAGFGDAWLVKNGFKSWRTSMGDIADAARYLSKQGIADPNRMAIVGWSYGGYAALLSAATNPELFKAVVAVAPVTDLGMLKEDHRDYTNYRMVAEEIGSGVHVAEGSPLKRVADIRVPVLLVHGDRDVNVNVRHSQAMDKALTGAGKTSEFLMFAGLDHQLEDSDARALMLSKAGHLLDRTIGH